MNLKRTVLVTTIAIIGIATTVTFAHMNTDTMGRQGNGMMSMMMGMYDRYMNDKQLDMMGAHMSSMHKQMDKIAAEEDEIARRQLLRDFFSNMQAHMKAPQETMGMMHGPETENWQQHMEGRMQQMEHRFEKLKPE